MKSENKLSFISGEADSEYTVVLKKKKRNFWWLLLLLLPLVLLIPISRTVNIHLSEQITGISVAMAKTDFVYPQRGVFGGFAYVTLSDSSNTEGCVKFSGIKQPLWAILFCKSDSAFVSASNDCFKADRLGYLYNSFPRSGAKEVALPPISGSDVFKVVDADDNQPLPDATVTIVKTVNEKSSTDNTTTDPAGNFDVNDIPACGDFMLVASKDGYENDTLCATLNGLDLLGESGKVLYLKPLKGNVKVIVKNLKTGTLLPGATVVLTVNGQSTSLRTNTNGVGVGCFDSLRIANTLEFKASKNYYADTTMGGYTVKDFINLDEEKRTMYLRPLSKSLVFLNTDGSGVKLSEVKNIISVNGANKATEYSDANGQFTLVGVSDNDKISINASKSGYNSNNIKIRNAAVSSLTTQDSRTIPLSKQEQRVNPPVNNRTDDLQGQSGDLRINLQWYCKTDLDLHVIDPCGNEIYFSKRSATCSGGKGTLDVDANAIIGTTSRPQENCYWLKPAPGQYTVKIVCFKFRERSQAPIPFNVTVVDKNGRVDRRSSISKGQTIMILKHTVN